MPSIKQTVLPTGARRQGENRNDYRDGTDSELNVALLTRVGSEHCCGSAWKTLETSAPMVPFAAKALHDVQQAVQSETSLRRESRC